MEDPTWRKANFLWKFLCAGAAIPDCGGDPIPTAVPPQGFLQSKNALRRRKTVGLLLGSLIVFASVQFNNRRVILAAQAAACLMWIVHYGLLGATTAATINILSFARSVVFYFNDRKWAQSRAWLWAFLALYVVNTVLTWAGPMSLLPGIAMSMTTVALWTRDMRRTRLLYLTNSPFWFTYDILARSYSCMVIEAIAFVSYAVAVWRFDIKKQPQT